MWIPIFTYFFFYFWRIYPFLGTFLRTVGVKALCLWMSVSVSVYVCARARLFVFISYLSIPKIKLIGVISLKLKMYLLTVKMDYKQTSAI